jgi:uncharacterized membrane protein
MNQFLKYFFRGLLFLVPVFITIYIILAAIQWLDSLVPVRVPGLGLIIILLVTTFTGYLASTLLAKPFIDLFEQLLAKVPLVNLIYSSMKDLISAFVGDKKKFNKAVIVTMNPAAGIQKIGFITQEDLAMLGMPGKVAVYCPHSYNFSGNLFIVPREQVQPIPMPASDIMKFIVSGGVSGTAEIINAIEPHKDTV